MAKKNLVTAIFCFCFIVTKAQHTIVYTFEQAVTDTLQNGINWFEKIYHKPSRDLKLYAIIAERDGNLEISIEEYSPMHLNGFFDLIRRSTRKLKINENTLIPIVFPSDVHSLQLQKDKIAYLPFSGYYIKIIYERLRLKTIETAILF